MSAAGVNQRLAALTAAGTSIWLDQLSRGMVASGELARMVEEDSLRGVTSNPSIFERAMLGTPDYDEALARAAAEGLTAREVYRRLAVEDVRAAADVLRPVYEQTGGLDGYVSLEVAPRLAHDTDGTLGQARLYHELVGRPNLMIKVPATEEGLPAIEQLLAEGIHVNVTLLFGVSAYRRVMEAYVVAMERRLAAGQPLEIHSVASFFVSRVDAAVDRRLGELDREDLMGRAAVANARAAYRAYREVFHGPRFERLRTSGCPAQRPLWASTGVKSPRYDPAKYVLELVGPETVNTMPLNTLRAVAEAGADIPSDPTVDVDPQADLDALREAGVDLDAVADELLRAGLDAFSASMRQLLEGVERRREAVVTGRPAAIEADLPDEFEKPVAERLRRAAQDDVARRIWARDASLWAPAGTPEVADRLGWLDIADRLHDEAPELAGWAAAMREEGFEDALLLGMGGSSLAPEVFRSSYGEAGGLRLHVLDTTEPRTIGRLRERLDPARTLVLVSTKSGGTIETLSLFKSFWEWSGRDGSRFVAITDPGSGLAALAEEHGFRRTFLNDPEIGGRYSALSYFGLVPAALAGVDVEGHLHQSEVAEENCAAWRDSRENSGLWLGCALGELAARGRDKVTYLVDPPLGSLGLWVEQLVAESTGKQGRGALPVADEPVGSPDRYGPDRVFVHVRNDEDPHEPHAELVAGAARAGHPAITVHAHGAGDLGRLFFLAEFATAVSGWVLGINPFDQPNVQEAKDNTARALGGAGGRPADGRLEDLLEDLAPPAYVAIMGYLPYDPATDEAVARLRDVLVARRGVATTWGYGPRFLHSTGQYHKGGPPTGRFLQLVHDGTDDLPVPGEDFGFRELISAQADGDLQTLREHDLPAVRLRLPADAVPAAIDELTARVEGSL